MPLSPQRLLTWRRFLFPVMDDFLGVRVHDKSIILRKMKGELQAISARLYMVPHHLPNFLFVIQPCKYVRKVKVLMRQAAGTGSCKTGSGLVSVAIFMMRAGHII